MMPLIDADSLDGVPILRAGMPVQRTMAALVFRVGRFDETLATAGITHLVEHLALASMQTARYRFNAEVSGRFTGFFMESADPQDVSDFIATVCEGLAASHEGRLEQEKRILRTEAASKGGSGALGASLGMRFGAQGPGLVAYEEFGLHRLSWPEIDAWRRHWFVQGNAVLWIAGDVPSGLRISLPPGPPPPDPAPKPLPADLPGYFVFGQGGVGMSTAAARSVAAVVTVDVLQQRLTKVLRHERGLSYSVQAIGQDLHRDLTHAWIAADALPDRVSITAHTMLGIIEQIAHEGCTPDEVQDYALRLRDAYQSPAGPAMALHGHAQNVLEQRPALTPDQILNLVSALTPGDVASACSELLSQAIVVTPTLVPAVDGRMHRVAGWSSEVISGDRTESHDPGRSLTVGPDGVMLTAGEGNHVTVRFDSVAALVKWADNKRSLVGNDGFIIQLDPAEWPNGDRLAASLDTRVSPERKISMDAPGPQNPKLASPPAPASQSAPGPMRNVPQKTRSLRKWAARFFAVLWLFLILFGVLAMVRGVFGGGTVFIAVGLIRLAAWRWRQYRGKRVSRPR